MMAIISLTHPVSDYVRIPCKQISGQNTLIGIGLIELTDPSETLNYESLFKHFVLQTIFTNYFTRIFIYYICVEKNLF